MKYEHEVIRDLMPLCIDGIASPQSKKAVKEHIAECPDCAKEWDNMKNGIQTYESPPLPEDTPKYAETAKRVRKHNRWMLLRITCCLAVIMFAVLLIANFKEGARFSARGAAEYMLRNNGIMCLYETPEDYRSAPKHTLTYLGEITAKEGDTKIIYELIETADGSLTAFAIVCVSRDMNVLHLGMWEEDGASFYDITGIYDGGGIYMKEDSFSQNVATASKGALAIYSTDSRVKFVNILSDSHKYAVSLNENGFGAVPADRRIESPEGTAEDADGNILYTLEPVTTEWGIGYQWIPVE